MNGEILYGFWATVNLNNINHRRSLNLLLNGENGLQVESLPLKNGTVNAIWEEMFHAGLESSSAQSEEINLIKQSEYISALLRKKSDCIGRLLSILLYICSDEPEIDSEYHPGTYPARPKPVKTKKGFRLFPSNSVHYWTVGDKTGRMLADTQAYSLTETTATGRHPHALLRRGHWHGFWSGKKDEPDARTFSYH